MRGPSRLPLSLQELWLRRDLKEVPHPLPPEGFLEKTPLPRGPPHGEPAPGLSRAPTFTKSVVLTGALSPFMVKTVSTLQAPSVGQALGLLPSGQLHTHLPSLPHFMSFLPSGPGAQWSVDFLVSNGCSQPVSTSVGSTLGTSEEVWDKVKGCWELAEG